MDGSVGFVLVACWGCNVVRLSFRSISDAEEWPKPRVWVGDTPIFGGFCEACEARESDAHTSISDVAEKAALK